MMKTRLATCIAVVALSIALVSCGNGSSSSTATPIAGNWQFTMIRDASNITKTQAGFLLQSGDTVDGTMLYTSGDTCTGIAEMTGTVSGNSVALAVQHTGVSITMAGAMVASGNSMNGTYTILSQGCGVSETGTWSASQIPPVSGTFSGTLTSLADGSSTSVSATIQQGTNSGASTAPVTGQLTTGSPCFSSASVQGTIGGTQLIWNLLASDGTQLGEMFMTLAPGPNPSNGKYVFNTHTDFPPQSPCRFGDRGTVTILAQ